MSWTQDMLLATREQRSQDSTNIRSEALQQNHFCTNRLFTVHEKVIQGGDQIVDFLQLDRSGSAQWINPQQRFDPVVENLDYRIERPWATVKADFTINKHEQALNGADKTAFFRQLNSKEVGARVALVEEMEDALWATPEVDTMETTIVNHETGQKPLSIPAICTRDGGAPDTTNGGVTGANWSTVAGISETKTNWANQYETYDADNPYGLDTASSLINTMGKLKRKCNFVTPDLVAAAGGDEISQMQGLAHAICTNNDGLSLYESALASRNDRTVNLVDGAYRGLMFDGTPVVYVSQLDSAGWTPGSPDYFFLSFPSIKPWVRNKTLEEHIIDGDRNHPLHTTVYKIRSCGIIPQSRKRLGRLSAAA